MRESIPVVQLVNQFAIGGAEGQFLARLAGHPSGFRPLVACLNEVGPHLEKVRQLGLPIEEFGLRGSLGQLNTGRQILKLAAFISREGAKLVHANDFYSNVLAVPAARLAGVQVICSRFDLGHWYSRKHHVLEALASRAADAVLTNATAVRDLCVHEEGILEERVVIVHNGIDLQAFDLALRAPLRTSIPEGRPTVIAIGNLQPVKGHLELIEAVERLRRRIPDLLVLCAGDGPMRPSLEQQIAERGLGECVLLLGHRDDVPALLARSQVGVLASHAEGLSNALIEAMAASLPVVATTVGGNTELVIEGGPRANGFLVPPYKSGPIADRLEQLLLDEPLRKALGAAARERVVAELNLAEMSRRTGDLYRRVLEKPKSTKPALTPPEVRATPLRLARPPAPRAEHEGSKSSGR